MPVNWTIAGETGKAFNATVRSLELAAIDSARLDFKSLDADTLTFTITPQSLTSATIPELRQEMILYRNGVQFFIGHVTDVRTMINSGSQQAQITVSGPWWWLERIPFTSIIADGTGVPQERISYVFGTASAGQGLAVSIRNAIDRSAQLGAPIATIAQGSFVDAMFTVPRITMNQSTCGQVISELVRICPDAMVWFDYSTKPVRVNVNRRGTVATTSFDVNTSPITSIDINPIIDLEVSNVVLPYVDRDTQGKTRFQVQTAGANVATKRQIITVSGPELDTFLPNDLFDFEYIRKVSIVDYVGYKITEFASFIQTYGFNPISSAWPTGTTASSIYFWSNGSGFTITNYNIPSANVPSGHYYVFGADGSSDPSDWVTRYLGLQTKNATGGIHGSFAYNKAAYETYKSQRSQDFFSLFGGNWWSDSTYAYCGGNIKNQMPIIYSATDHSSKFVNINLVVQSRVQASSGWVTVTLKDPKPTKSLNGLPIYYTYTISGATYTAYKTIEQHDIASGTFKFWSYTNSPDIPPVNKVLLTNFKMLYKPGDYSFISPPADLSANLLAAQNWIPYEGSVQLEQEDVGGTRYRGTKVNISNSQTAFATMGALVSGETIELETGRTTINLGAPSRNDYRTLVDKIRKTSQDNIVYI